MPDEESRQSESLASFLVRMAEDPHSLLRLNENPEQVLEEANLLRRDEEALRSGDPDTVRRAIVESLPGVPSRLAREEDAFTVSITIHITVGQ